MKIINLLIASFVFASVSAMAAQPLKIGNTEYYGGTYQCQSPMGSFKISLQAVELPAIPQPMFMMVMKAEEPELQAHMRTSPNFPINVGGSQLAPDRVKVGSLEVNSSFNGTYDFMGIPSACQQIEFQFPLQ